jgi:hypothetical protein
MISSSRFLQKTVGERSHPFKCLFFRDRLARFCNYRVRGETEKL